MASFSFRCAADAVPRCALACPACLRPGDSLRVVPGRAPEVVGWVEGVVWTCSNMVPQPALARAASSGAWASVLLMYRAFGRRASTSKLTPKTDAVLRQLRRAARCRTLEELAEL